MKFLKALFNIISIINPFRVYNCILCYLAEGEGGCVKISYGRMATVGDVLSGKHIARVPKHLTKYFLNRNFAEYKGSMNLIDGLPGKGDLIQ